MRCWKLVKFGGRRFVICAAIKSEPHRKPLTASAAEDGGVCNQTDLSRDSSNGEVQEENVTRAACRIFFLPFLLP